MPKYAEMVKLFLAHGASQRGLNRIVKGCSLVSAANGKLRVEMKVGEDITNPMGTLHGGASAALVDTLTTAALFGSRGSPGVSVDIHMTYLSAAKEGETIFIDAEIVKLGRSLAFLKGEIRRKRDNAIVATGLQTMALTDVKINQPEG